MTEEKADENPASANAAFVSPAPSASSTSVDAASSPETQSALKADTASFRLRSVEAIEEVLKAASTGKLISEKVADEFLRVKGATALNLLILEHAIGNEKFLRRAAELFPDHPAVQAEILNRKLFPEDRAEWITRFKASAPDDPLPFIVSAADALRAQDTATALAEASSAIQKPGFYMWHNELIQASQQLYEFAGFTPLEAELLATVNRSVPHVSAFDQLSRELINWNKEVREGGECGRSG